MTTYITQEQAGELLNSVGGTWEGCIREDKEFLHKSMNAAIQAYRDSLVAGVVLPKPDFKYQRYDDTPICDYYTADQLRQAIAEDRAKREPDYEQSETYLRKTDGIDALAKQVTRAPMFEFRECEDSQAAYQLRQAIADALPGSSKPKKVKAVAQSGKSALQ